MYEYLINGVCGVAAAGFCGLYFRASREERRLVTVVSGLEADIQSARDAEADLRAACEQAERAAMSKTIFLANMSHEIRTPMNGVIGFTELLLASDLDGEQRKQANLIGESGRSMLRLLNDILDVTQIESGQVRLCEEAADLRELLHNCTKLLEPIAQAKELSLTLRIDDDIPELVQIDRERMRQILLNLIGNAVKFTQIGRIDVEVCLDQQTAVPNILISVIDTGCGMDQDKQDSVFSLFTQGEQTRAEQHGSSGLGLTISSQLVTLMGGAITVESRPGFGSNFTVRIPLREPASDKNLANLEPTPVALLPQELQYARVLIAEDHAINQQLILSMIETLGLTAELVEDGRKAVDAVVEADARSDPFDIVLMDVQMPKTSGLEASRLLRALGYSAQKLPIIALTANCYPDDIAECLAAGMQSHVGKPVELHQLAKQISLLLKPKDAARKNTPAAVNDILSQTGEQSAIMRDLEQKYRSRKARLFDEIGRSLGKAASETDWNSLVGNLHRLAGVAANFGDTKLGEISRRLERQLKVTPQDDMRREALEREWPELQQFA